MTEYVAEQWDIDRLEYLEQQIKDRDHLIAFDLRVEIQKLKRQKK